MTKWSDDLDGVSRRGKGKLVLRHCGQFEKKDARIEAHRPGTLHRDSRWLNAEGYLGPSGIAAADRGPRTGRPRKVVVADLNKEEFRNSTLGLPQGGQDLNALARVRDARIERLR